MLQYAPQAISLAKQMRRQPTDAEKGVWKILRDRNLVSAKFRRQQPIDRYIVDFACHQHRLIVEIDGGLHDEDRDAQRNAALSKAVYRIIRFWNHDVLNNIDGVAAVITTALAASPSPTAPSQQAGKASYPLPPGERDRSANHV